ncbi:MAG: response regulator [Syntrophobacteraceae bacterium]
MKTQTPGKLLVIEDDEILRQSLLDYLEDRGFELLEAENGRIGLEILRREKPDLILTDLRMPELDGLEVIRQAAASAPQTPVIVVSGTGKIGDAIEALRCGARDYILKPVEDMAIISLAVESALEWARLVRENREYQTELERKVAERTQELEAANEQLHQLNLRLRTVAETTRNLSQCRETGECSAKLLQEFARLMQANGGSIYLIEKSGLRLLHTFETEHTPQFISFPLERGCVFERTIEQRCSILIPDIAMDSETEASGWSGYTNGSLLTFPFRNQAGEVIGVITLHNSTKPSFDEQDKEIGNILASHASEVLRAIQALEGLRESEARLRKLAELLPEGIFEIDADGRPVFLNQRMHQLFHYTTEDFSANLDKLTIFIPEDRDRVKAFVRRQLAGEETGIQEYTGLRKDGSTFPVLVNASPVFSNDKVVGTRGIIIDITERKRLEEQLLHTRKMESLGTLAKGIAHDFNNILSGIFGFTDLALLHLRNQEKQAAYLKGINRAAERAKLLVQQILTFSREGRQEKLPLHLAPLTKEVLQLIRNTFPETISICSNIDSSRKIFADPTQIHRVLMNLCTNACQAMREDGGTLSVTTADCHLDRELNMGNSVIAPGEYVVMQVADTGTGMDEKTIQRIFEPYFTTKSVGEGTGLGLSVVQGIIADHQGHIVVKSEKGLGTTFCIYLPQHIDRIC